MKKYKILLIPHKISPLVMADIFKSLNESEFQFEHEYIRENRLYPMILTSFIYEDNPDKSGSKINCLCIILNFSMHILFEIVIWRKTKKSVNQQEHCL